MTTHELAAKLLEGPNVKVVIVAAEPNDETFDEIKEIEVSCRIPVSWNGLRNHDNA